NQVRLEQKNEWTPANTAQTAQQVNPKISELNHETAGMELQITEKENSVNNLYNTYISEAEGTAGTKVLGKGPMSRETRDNHDDSFLELQQLKKENKEKIATLENQITKLENTYNTQVKNAQPVIDGFDGLMARINALGKLPWLPSFFIFLLFLA